MKKKKLLSVILTFALLFTGCGTAKPASVVESAIKCLQENKLDEAREYFAKEDTDETEAVEKVTDGTEEDTEDAVGNAFLGVMNDFAKEHAKDITYEIKDTKEDGDEATVTVKVTYKDAGAVTKLAYQDMIEQSVSNALTTSLAGAGGDIDESDISAIFIKSFENAQDSAAFVDKSEKLKISCKKVDGKWKISDSTDLLNVYYGNILNTLEKLTPDDSDSDDDNKADTEADTEADTSEQETTDTEPSEAESDSAADNSSDVTTYDTPTTASYTTWDDTSEVIVDMTYTGENSSGQMVGNFTFTINDSEDSSDSQQISGSFIENEDGTGTMTKSNGQTMDYSIYWSTDHNNMTVTGVDGSSTIDLMDATWAYDNVG